MVRSDCSATHAQTQECRKRAATRTGSCSGLASNRDETLVALCFGFSDLHGLALGSQNFTQRQHSSYRKRLPPLLGPWSTKAPATTSSGNHWTAAYIPQVQVYTNQPDLTDTACRVLTRCASWALFPHSRCAGALAEPKRCCVDPLCPRFRRVERSNLATWRRVGKRHFQINLLPCCSPHAEPAPSCKRYHKRPCLGGRNGCRRR